MFWVSKFYWIYLLQKDLMVFSLLVKLGFYMNNWNKCKLIMALFVPLEDCDPEEDEGLQNGSGGKRKLDTNGDVEVKKKKKKKTSKLKMPLNFHFVTL